MKDLRIESDDVIVYYDNQDKIQLGKNNMFHDETKHIRVRYHFIQDDVNSRKLKVADISTNDNGADLFTKSLQGPKFLKCSNMLDVGGGCSRP